MEEVEKLLREKTGDPNGCFDSALVIQDGVLVSRRVIGFRHRRKKMDGSYTSKTYTVDVVIKFDPFTGEPLPGTEKNPAP